MDTAVVFPTPPQNKIEEAKKILLNLVDKHGVQVISIGNGTASKESEIFVANMIKESGKPLSYAVVNEAGASVYSASKLGATEFPDFEPAQRSAVSIARRLLDPLAELIKIDVKSIGVGQYQHDMPEARLEEVLGGVVEDCVNAVGVDINTASPSLLAYIAGINATAAKNIVKYREENGEFKTRAQITKVPRIGAKAYEQCAGFLRVTESREPLDTILPFEPSDFLISEGEEETMTSPELSLYIDKQQARGIANIQRFEVEYHKRIAMSFAAFIMTVIGASLSSRKRKGGMGLSLGIGLGLSFSYILFQTISSAFAEHMPVALAVWIPNILYAILAIILYRKAPR